jgi:L-lysine exporter family protein LysE/ArgO
MFDYSPFAQGFALALGMFVCPGPKDLVILRQALRLRPTAELLTVGVGSDALLITLGILGVSAALQRAPQVQQLALWLGVGLMLWHGVHAILRLIAGSTSEKVDGGARSDRAALLLVSFLNPVAWMDTVLVIGTTGAVLPGRLQFSYGLGAVSASTVWFLLLTLGARQSAQWMASARARRVLDALVAVAMIGMAGFVAAGLL